MLKKKKLVPVAGFATVALAAVLGLTACGGDTASTTEGSADTGEATQTGMTMDARTMPKMIFLPGKLYFASTYAVQAEKNTSRKVVVAVRMMLLRNICRRFTSLTAEPEPTVSLNPIRAS